MRYVSAIYQEEQYFFEVDEEQTCWRQVIWIKGKCLQSSNQKYKNDGFILTDQAVNCRDHNLCTAGEFGRMWKLANRHNIKKYNSQLIVQTIGAKIYSKLEVNYPHGVLCSDEIGQIYCADHEEMVQKYSTTNLYPGQLFEGEVYAFDPVNYWFLFCPILES